MLSKPTTRWQVSGYRFLVRRMEHALVRLRYGIKDADAQKALGMDFEHATPEPAPWPIVGLLPGGSALGRQDAMVAHDGVARDANPAKQLVQSE